MGELLIGIAFIIFASKVAPAVAKRLSSHAGDPDLGRKVDEMDRRLAQNEERLLELAAGTHERFVDAEERLDFTERVIQQQRERSRLPGAADTP
ncbi:MAG: hypothetical protein JSW43_12775 [Gemmatimonadota bacterium]|nr:MAG: hypothetical protein JSW43_12775 [Gemmatimonadota bacterium]